MVRKWLQRPGANLVRTAVDGRGDRRCALPEGACRRDISGFLTVAGRQMADGSRHQTVADV